MAADSKALLIVRALQLTLPRAAAGWLFALLTSNFNRIALLVNDILLFDTLYRKYWFVENVF